MDVMDVHNVGEASNGEMRFAEKGDMGTDEMGFVEKRATLDHPLDRLPDRLPAPTPEDGALALSIILAMNQILFSPEKEFRVEVEAIGRVRHKNLVRLLGYRMEGALMMLVYEYIDNGNLEQWLHGDVGLVSPLTWEIRMNIILGTAKGLAYLHEGLEPKVVHRDVKSSNILLDRHGMLSPHSYSLKYPHSKITDFGISAGLENSVAMGLENGSIYRTFLTVFPSHSFYGCWDPGSWLVGDGSQGGCDKAEVGRPVEAEVEAAAEADRQGGRFGGADRQGGRGGGGGK
ncbi:hypothetical protein Syun_006641 [Stephania yunnanensis]|uniref:Protein kinase domain-containing protein n=1 Tax=Stephania yunnanensis TaxID=152371 RepID=A0AAP0PYP7_9MAGN